MMKNNKSNKAVDEHSRTRGYVYIHDDHIYGQH